MVVKTTPASNPDNLSGENGIIGLIGCIKLVILSVLTNMGEAVCLLRPISD